MYFQCRGCGKVSEDIDQVLEGTCECGCTHFKLLSERPLDFPVELEMKESIRQDLHRWIDLNLDSMSPETIGNIRVSFECDGSKKTQNY
jgi:predicted  nucleic acid-binding Zn-ribbon protein